MLLIDLIRGKHFFAVLLAVRPELSADSRNPRGFSEAVKEGGKHGMLSNSLNSKSSLSTPFCICWVCWGHLGIHLHGNKWTYACYLFMSTWSRESALYVSVTTSFSNFLLDFCFWQHGSFWCVDCERHPKAARLMWMTRWWGMTLCWVDVLTFDGRRFEWFGGGKWRLAQLACWRAIETAMMIFRIPDLWGILFARGRPA